MQHVRPTWFEEFVGQESIKKVLDTAIQSAKQSTHTLWHILFSGPSWYGKTTLSTIVASTMEVPFKVVTGYALSKPAEMISLLNGLESGAVLFIDEIHRLRPNVEEVLYIAMEDYSIDMVMPDWTSVRLPLEPFTLIAATTKPETLSQPLKNRFLYSFHLEPYTYDDKVRIIKRYLDTQSIEASYTMIEHIEQYVSYTPREIASLAVQLRDYIIVHGAWSSVLSESIREGVQALYQRSEWGLSTLQQRYLEVLERAYPDPVWSKTLAATLNISQKAIEDDVEPLLFQNGRITKSSRGRALVR